MSDIFKVTDFSNDSFCEALSNNYFSPSQVRDHKRAKFLEEHLMSPAISAKTIVVEAEYTDGDYLDDFASYYVKCFKEYKRRCKRVHFFSSPFNDKLFCECVQGTLDKDKTAELMGSYLGFVVARPLPDAIIGRTIIKPKETQNVHYPTLRKYDVNLFGMNLSVNSVAFQEQDTVLAACATVALWCSFHVAQAQFHTPTPTPAAITRAANRMVGQARPVPSHGLNVQQMCSAIQQNGLEAEVIAIKPQTPLSSLAYAYLQGGLPVILGVRIEGMSEPHALVLNGYVINSSAHLTTEVHETQKPSVPMVGLRIEEFFLHDDQIGPFASARIEKGGLHENKPYPITLVGPWKNNKSTQYLRIYPQVAVVPVYGKIRVTFIDVLEWITRFNDSFQSLVPVSAKAEWDIALTTTNKLKSSFGRPAKGVYDRMLWAQHPRFLWRSVLSISGKMVLEILIDGTDMARSFPIYEAIWHDDTCKKAYKDRISDPAMQLDLIRILKEPFLKLLKHSE